MYGLGTANSGHKLLDDIEKLFLRRVFEAGRQHRKHESHPVSDANRENILKYHPFRADYISQDGLFEYLPEIIISSRGTEIEFCFACLQMFDDQLFCQFTVAGFDGIDQQAVIARTAG